ncbi:hypothetical protein DU490_15225 [Halomonas sp. DQ26W]|nr:hypothetical protein DU490_15225 [Halomonas sp. DQ26W]
MQRVCELSFLIRARIFGVDVDVDVDVDCLCRLLSMNLIPDELLKKFLGRQQRITPIAQLVIRDPASIKQKSKLIQEVLMMSVLQKTCSICGKSYESAEFSYGNRAKRSYCRSCNKTEKAAYSAGGVESAQLFRETQRAKWKD